MKMRRFILSAALSASVCCLAAAAQPYGENRTLPADSAWGNPRVNEVNRAPMHATLDIENLPTVSLHGLWKFDWVENAWDRPEDYYRTDYDDKGWGTEQQNHVGTYRRWIEIPAGWKGQDVFAHFGSVTSNITLYVNGQYVGYSEDSKMEAVFDITPYIKPGEKNLLAFQVFRWCDGTYLEDQDFWRLNGVARESYLYARSPERLLALEATPDLDASYKNGTLAIKGKVTEGVQNVGLTLTSPEGRTVGRRWPISPLTVRSRLRPVSALPQNGRPRPPLSTVWTLW